MARRLLNNLKTITDSLRFDGSVRLGKAAGVTGERE
jgi:hypothetical protein